MGIKHHSSFAVGFGFGLALRFALASYDTCLHASPVDQTNHKNRFEGNQPKQVGQESGENICPQECLY
jgi:hypothetical protein